MSHHHHHAPGLFCWVELATTDADAAKKFYGGLFGWTYDDSPMGPDEVYTMCKLGEHVVGALFKMGKDHTGQPPHWGAYVSVANADETAAKAEKAGGKLIAPPFDVMDHGRMAVIADPSGAVFNIWQAKSHHGVGVREEHGALTYNEVYTDNVDRAGKFYADTFGWVPEAMDMGPMGTYTLFKHHKGENKNAAGMMPLTKEMQGIPPHWLSYFHVNQCDDAVKKAAELGAKVLMPAMDIPNVGRFAVIADPQGAAFALFEMHH